MVFKFSKSQRYFAYYYYIWIGSGETNRQLEILTSLEGLVTQYRLSHHDFVTSRLLIPTIISICVWVSLKFHRSIEELLNLVIEFDENIKTSFTFKNLFTLFELKQNLKFTRQPGKLFQNSINMNKILISNKKF